jgi:hypothetical protein
MTKEILKSSPAGIKPGELQPQGVPGAPGGEVPSSGQTMVQLINQFVSKCVNKDVILSEQQIIKGLYVNPGRTAIWTPEILVAGNSYCLILSKYKIEQMDNMNSGRWIVDGVCLVQSTGKVSNKYYLSLIHPAPLNTVVDVQDAYDVDKFIIKASLMPHFRAVSSFVPAATTTLGGHRNVNSGKPTDLALKARSGKSKIDAETKLFEELGRKPNVK